MKLILKFLLTLFGPLNIFRVFSLDLSPCELVDFLLLSRTLDESSAKSISSTRIKVTWLTNNKSHFFFKKGVCFKDETIIHRLRASA